MSVFETQLRHGHARRSGSSPTWNSWRGMIKRCTEVTGPRYHDYGGRGITVCKRWLKFENFLADMGERPAGKTLDRRNNDKGYCKSNCRWATRQEQLANKRQRKDAHTVDGLTMRQWSDRLGITVGAARARAYKGTLHD